MNRAMALAQPFSRSAAAADRVDIVNALRSLIVIGCAAALILASKPLPF